MDVAIVDTLWILLGGFLVFMMQAGFLCLESGLTRTKNNINVAIKGLTDFALTTIIFWICGYGLMFGKSQSGWFGIDSFLPDFAAVEIKSFAFFFFQVMFCGAAVTIMTGAIAERMKFSSFIMIVSFITAIIYPIYGHWVWNGAWQHNPTGWLGELGFVDFAGSSVVHSVGGWTSLAILLLLGPRLGRFQSDGVSHRFAVSNVPLASLGVLLLWFGWFGFNGGSTLGLVDQEATVIRIIVNTAMAGSTGLVACLLLGWWLRGRPDIDLVINGGLGGLVAITANCHAVSLHEAAVIGAIGAWVMLIVDYLLEYFKVDDAVGAIQVHLGAGIWGTLAVGLFGDLAILDTGLNRGEQILAQLVGIFACGIWSFCLTYLFVWFLNKWQHIRVDEEGETIGLNVAIHGARTDLIDLLMVMENQAETGDLSMRVEVDPFTEVGQIANRYNRLIQALEKATELTESTIRTAMDGIITFSTEGLRITTLNPAAETIFGYPAQQLMGQSLMNLLTPAPNQTKPWQGERLLFQAAEGDAYEEVWGKRQDGTLFPMEIAVTQAHLGAESFYIGFFRDITERKQAQRALLAAKEAAEAANRSKSTFLANMSHELRTPLNAILGYTDLVLGRTYGDITDLQGERLTRVLENGRHLLGLINDLLDLSKVEAGKMELYLETFKVQTVVETVVNSIRPLIDKNENQLDIFLGEGVDISYADQTKVQQILLNLLSNASKFTQKGLIRLIVERADKGDEPWIRYRVSDSGIGMSEEQAARVFDEFVQADNSTTRKYGGTGLGLAIARRFCIMMGGNMWVESAIGQGSTFTVYMPLYVTDNQPSVDVIPMAILPDRHVSHDAPLVLVIDDDPVMRDLLNHYLMERDFQVALASSGSEGLRLALELLPDVITLDVMMPEVDGWYVLSALKNDPQLAHIPVVMLSMLSDRRTGFALGASDYLVKPIQPSQLDQVLEKYRDQSDKPVLIVEDDPSTRQLLRDMLEANGWQVAEAEDGLIGMQELRKVKPHLILLDLMMPRMDGFVFVEAVRQLDDFRQTPIVVITAMDLTQEDRLRLEGRIQSIIQKASYSQDELLALVYRLVKEHLGQSDGEIE